MSRVMRVSEITSSPMATYADRSVGAPLLPRPPARPRDCLPALESLGGAEISLALHFLIGGSGSRTRNHP